MSCNCINHCVCLWGQKYLKRCYEDTRIFLLEPLPPLCSSPPHPHLEPNHLKTQIWSYYSPVQNPSLPIIHRMQTNYSSALNALYHLPPNLAFQPISHHITHPSSSHPLPDTSPQWSFPAGIIRDSIPPHFPISKILVPLASPISLPHLPKILYSRV